MKLKFLGTGAAGCAKKAESEIKEGDRRCSSVLIDENILIDIPLQAYDYAIKLGIDVSKITDVFLTHAHNDHFQKKVLLDFARTAKTKLNFWCQKDALENLGFDGSERELININTVNVMDKWESGGVTVTALAANHITAGNEQPLHYVFEKDGKSLFYGCDGGWFVAQTWEYMRKIKLNAVVLDATVGDDAGNYRIGTHNSIPMLRILNEALVQNNIMEKNAPKIANHIATSVYNMSEDDIFLAHKNIGMISAYDGFEIEI